MLCFRRKYRYYLIICYINIAVSILIMFLSSGNRLKQLLKVSMYYLIFLFLHTKYYVYATLRQRMSKNVHFPKDFVKKCIST
jgi:hypothetical protein